MQDILMIKLHEYIVRNNPDLLVTLDNEGKVVSYLEEKVASITTLVKQLLAEGKPSYIIEELCMEELTSDLPPSKFNYLLSVLEEEFKADYYRLKESGILTYEVINLIEVCKPVFETLAFTEENENNRHLRYAITGAIKEYLENKQ